MLTFLLLNCSFYVAAVVNVATVVVHVDLDVGVFIGIGIAVAHVFVFEVVIVDVAVVVAVRNFKMSTKTCSVKRDGKNPHCLSRR